MDVEQAASLPWADSPLCPEGLDDFVKRSERFVLIIVCYRYSARGYGREEL